MAFDDIIVGSGLSALGVALALSQTERRVLCLAGNTTGRLSTYPGGNVPCAFDGPGGLGNFWHGVIPLAPSNHFENLDGKVLGGLLSHFYPGFPVQRLGTDALFVPFRPIRPAGHLARLARKSERLELRQGLVRSLQRTTAAVVCRTDEGTLEAGRVWVACGALATPRLLEGSELIEPAERSVSDHVIGYAGLVATHEAPAVARKPERVPGGIVFACDYDARREVLYMPRPARLDFARLDAGMEKRAVFGLPTSRILAGLAGRFSPGLMAEALFNKFGLFPIARQHSVNYLVEAPARYRLDAHEGLVPAAGREIAGIAQRAIEGIPYAALQPTRRPELVLPGIHLHGSLTDDERRMFAGNSSIQVVDASALLSIGPDHHSFRMLALAYQRAATASGVPMPHA